ncbi:MAG: tetratricopeptide repeat protein, partial [Cyclobacteriaceae bacterium]
MLKTIQLSIIICLICSIAVAQTNPGQIIQAAFQKVNAGNAAEAITDLNNFLVDNPTHYGALSALGFAYRGNQEYSKSVEAYEKAEKAQPGPRANFNLGVAYALSSDLDKSFEKLIQVKESNALNLTVIGLSPAAAVLSKDARYELLFPSKAEYADPFTEENVEILQDWGGENPNDQFGWIGRNIGDVDGDGIW